MKSRFNNLRNGIVGLAMLAAGCAASNVINIPRQNEEYARLQNYIARGNRDIDRLSLYSETLESIEQIFAIRDHAKSCADSASAIYSRLPEKDAKDYFSISDLKGRIYLASGEFEKAGGYFMDAIGSLQGESRQIYLAALDKRYKIIEESPYSSRSARESALESRNYFEQTYGSDRTER